MRFIRSGSETTTRTARGKAQSQSNAPPGNKSCSRPVPLSRQLRVESPAGLLLRRHFPFLMSVRSPFSLFRLACGAGLLAASLAAQETIKIGEFASLTGKEAV